MRSGHLAKVLVHICFISALSYLLSYLFCDAVQSPILSMRSLAKQPSNGMQAPSICQLLDGQRAADAVAGRV
jgi:hypothetical protein